MRNIDKIILHHSASPFGDVKRIDQWHRDRGFREIGYHYVILNGCRNNSKDYDVNEDGLIEDGRDIERYGAHCRGNNMKSVGVCLIGDDKKDYTQQQIYSLLQLLKELCARYKLEPLDAIYGHKELDYRKPVCPNLDMQDVRDALDINPIKTYS